MRRSFIIVFCTLLASLPVVAETNWGLRTNVGIEKGISKGFDAELEAKYYQTDNFKNTDRWSVGVSLSKRLYRNEAKTFNVKAGLGYKFMSVYHGWSTKCKEDSVLMADGLDPNEYFTKRYDFNYYDTYIDHRHRFTTSLQASLELGRFKFSVREAYQYTYTDSADYAVSRYRYANASRDSEWARKKGYTKLDGNYYLRSDMDGKAASGKSLIRSRISVDYDIPHWKYDPFVSYELFNGIDDGFKAEKSRFTAGVEFSFNKKHNFEVAYMWQNQHDDDEPAGSFICLSYKWEL